MKENTTVVAVDIAKAVFQLAISESPDEPPKDRRLRRSEFLAFFERLSAAVVAMEACGSAHYWAREIQALGHIVELIPPHLVRPYVPRNGPIKPTRAPFWKHVVTATFISFRSSPSLNRSWARCIAFARAGSALAPHR